MPEPVPAKLVLDPDSPPVWWEPSGYNREDWCKVAAHFSSPTPDYAGRATVTEHAQEPARPGYNPFAVEVKPEVTGPGGVTPMPQQPNPFQHGGVSLASPNAILGLKIWSA
jgi:hypothetical protein